MTTTRSMRIITLAVIALGLLKTAHAAPADGASDFYLKDGDRVVFYGDSITDHRLYTTFAETFVVTRFPAMTVTFTHSGWGGDRVTGGGGGTINKRLERDVYPYNPTVMTIMLGMNDGSYRSFDESIFNTYNNGLTSIVAKVKEKIPGIRMTLIQPSPYDDVTRAPKFSGGYNAVLVRYGAAVKKLAQASGQLDADLNTSVVAMLEKAKAADPKLAEHIIGDRVHPGAGGHLIMAAALLKAWNAPAIVSEVAIDAAAKKIARTANTEITNFNATTDTLTWTQLDAALPMPVDMNNPETKLAVNSSDFVNELNQQLLRVTGLTGANYTLNIDGKAVGNFTAAQLAAGINLAMLDTPMAAQAAEVHKLTVQRATFHNTRWRTFEVPYATATGEVADRINEVMRALDGADAASAKLQHAAAQPVAHRYELTRTNANAEASAAPAPSTSQGTSGLKLPAKIGPNLALAKSWVSSDTNTRGWNTGLTDGDWSMKRDNTFATNDRTTHPKHVTIDLEAPVEIAHIVIGVPNFGSTKTIAVSISADGNTFKEIGRYTFPQGKEEKRVFGFSPETARYVKLSYPDFHEKKAGNYSNRFAFTTDVQVFAPVK